MFCFFAFAPKHMKNVAGAQSFWLSPTHSDLQRFLKKRPPTENATYMHACMQSEPSDERCFSFSGEGGEGGEVGAIDW